VNLFYKYISQLSFLCFLLPSLSVNAQLIPDSSLGKENSTVNFKGDRDLIEGGAIRDRNLFHSFKQFNVNPNQKVYFSNPDNITNILTRVTGSNLSKILGTLGVNGNANLFLINPKGIVFGENVKLDIKGSFSATTAESIFIDNYEFNAVNPERLPLLKINLTPGLQYGKINPQSEIENSGILKVGEKQNLTLLARKVNHTDTASLIAPGGKVELSGDDINLQGIVDTRGSNGEVGFLLIDPKNILIQENGDFSGDAISEALAVNNVILQANNDITVDDDITGITSNNLTFEIGRSLTIAENRDIILNGGSFNAKINDQNALASERDTGIAEFRMNSGSSIITNGGNVNVVSGSFGNTSQINTAFGGIITGSKNGDGGNINLSATGDISTGFMASGFINNPNLALLVSDFFEIDTLPGTVKAGNINIDSSSGNIASTNFVLANALNQGGDINFNAAGNLTFSAAGEVSELGDVSSVGMIPGKLNLNSGKTLLASDVRILNRINGDGEAKGITLSGKSVLIENSSISTLTKEFKTDVVTMQNATGGDIRVEAEDDLVVRNGEIHTKGNSNELDVSFTNINPNIGGIFGKANAGEIIVNARRVKVIKDAQQPEVFKGFSRIITTGGDNPNGGGDITINATESVEVIGKLREVFIADSLEDFVFLSGATISTRTAPTGTSGDLTVNTQTLIVKDEATVSTYPFIGKGGDLTVNARDILIRGKANISTATSDLDAGNLNVFSNRIALRDGGRINTSTFGTGDAGDLTLFAKELSIDENSSIGTSSFNLGSGGILNIDADSIDIIGSPDKSVNFSGNNTSLSGINATSYAIGDAGTINITSDELTLTQGGKISTATFIGGAGGKIDINTRTLQLNNGIINASTTTDKPGGNIYVNASESVEVIGDGFEKLQQNIIIPATSGDNNSITLNNFDNGIVTASDGVGDSGNIFIQTPNFKASNGGLIATTTLNQGAGGDITINADNILEIDNSLLGTGTFTQKASGNINLSARQLTAKGGAQVLTTTFDKGKAGNLNVTVSDSIDLIDPSQQGIASGLFATSFENASGDGGNINVKTGDFNIVDRAAVSVSGEGEGNAGNIDIEALKLFLDNSSITAQSVSGVGGNINLRIADLLLLRNNSTISTSAGTETSSGGNGGNITINGGLVVAVPEENSDINANAFQGNGGNINITTPGLFGIQFRDRNTPNSDITASSQFGIDGNFNLNLQELDITSGLVELPENLTDTADRIAAGCPTDEEAQFVTSGRGGIPQNPRQVLQGEVILQDLRNTVNSTMTVNSTSTGNNDKTIVEATGWIVNKDGVVEFVADNIHAQSISPNCQAVK
jgi:filamentous hemagglutinin family protein